jgi:hypothetical protein
MRNTIKSTLLVLPSFLCFTIKQLVVEADFLKIKIIFLLTDNPCLFAGQGGRFVHVVKKSQRKMSKEVTSCSLRARNIILQKIQLKLLSMELRCRHSVRSFTCLLVRIV